MRIVRAALLVLLSSSVAGLGVPASFGQAATNSKKKTSSNNRTTVAESSPPGKRQKRSRLLAVQQRFTTQLLAQPTRIRQKRLARLRQMPQESLLLDRLLVRNPQTARAKTPTADRVNQIQAALARDGSFQGPPSGKWDDNTVAAMRRFQTAHGLNPSGKLDAPTLQRLGLGSETAGVAAPTPPPGATSRLTSSANIVTAPLQSGRRQ